MAVNTVTIRRRLRRAQGVTGYVGSILLMAGGTLVFTGVQQFVGLEVANISLCYIVVVLLAAVNFGLGPAILASVLSFLAYNFFFVPPLYTLTVGDSQNVIRLFLYLGIAVITSSVAAASRARAEEARYRARIQQALDRLSQAISAEVDLAAILPTITEQIIELLPVRGSTILIYDDDTLRSTSSYGTVGSEGTAVVTRLQAGDRTLGLLRVWPRSDESLSDDDQRLLEALARQAALAIERTRLIAESTHLQVVAESDRMKSTLLHSISHDLKTPLVTIRGAVGNLLDTDVRWNPADEQALLHTIDIESDRLARLVRNLLDMSRIEAGMFQPPVEPTLVEDVLGPVLQRLRATLSQHKVEVVLPDDLPLVPMSPLQIDQVLTNILENAVRYAPPTTTITISARVHADAVEISIADQGPGIPATEREHVFEKFYRLSAPETSSAGTGLGLAIARSAIEAHHGRIWAHDTPGGGTTMTFSLPLGR